MKFLENLYFIFVLFSVDYKICKHVDDNPQAYLVPHPEDCTKFYSCQNLGNYSIFKNKNISPKKYIFLLIFIFFLGWRGGYIAHLMDCPPTTGFDTKLRICNYIRALPRCNKGMTHFFFRKKTIMPRTSVLFSSHRCEIV